MSRLSGLSPSPRHSSSAILASDCGLAMFSSPRFTAAPSIISRRNRMSPRPSAVIRAFTFSMPTAWMTMFVEELSLTIIISVA